MKKHLKLPITLELVEYPGQSVLDILFTREALRDWCLGLCLLRFGFVQELIVREERRTKRLEIEAISTAAHETKAQAHFRSETAHLMISPSQLDYLLSFFLKYYRDDIAPVDHLDLEAIAVGTRSQDAYITFSVPDFAPPLSPEEAEKWLRDKP